MSPTTRSVKKHMKVKQRRRLTAQERLARDRRQAQQAAQALQQALDALGLPEDLVTEIEGRYFAQSKKALGPNIVARHVALGCRACWMDVSRPFGGVVWCCPHQ